MNPSIVPESSHARTFRVVIVCMYLRRSCNSYPLYVQVAYNFDVCSTSFSRNEGTGSRDTDHVEINIFRNILHLGILGDTQTIVTTDSTREYLFFEYKVACEYNYTTENRV